MCPLGLPLREVLHAVRAFDSLIVQAEARVFHRLTLLDEQTDQRVCRQAFSDGPFGLPVRRRVPLAGGSGTHELPPVDLQKHPVREAPAIERPGLSARVERTPGAAAGPLEVFALRLDCRMISAFRRIRRPPVCRRAVLSAVSEDIRPTDTGQRRLPGSLRQRDSARLQLGDQIRDLLCCFHVHPSRSVSSGTSSSLERLAATRARRKPPIAQPIIIPIRNITIPIGITSKEAGRQDDPDGHVFCTSTFTDTLKAADIVCG